MIPRNQRGQDEIIEESFELLTKDSQQILKLRSHWRIENPVDAPLNVVEIARLLMSNIPTVVGKLHRARTELIELCQGQLSPPFLDPRARTYFGNRAWLISLGSNGKVKRFQTLPTFGRTAESALAEWHTIASPIIGSRKRMRGLQERIRYFERAENTEEPSPSPADPETTIYLESADDLLGHYLERLITQRQHDACLVCLESENED